MVLEALRPQSSQYTPNATRDAWTVLLSGEAENQFSGSKNEYGRLRDTVRRLRSISERGRSRVQLLLLRLVSTERLCWRIGDE
jgi:hypothetical protein